MSGQEAPRQRAPRRSVEERRAMVVAAAIPLLAELGPSVTTLQIARAAGISEPTVFRAFTDKDELLAACLAHVSDPTRVIAELAAVDPELPLRERLVAVIDAVSAQAALTGAVVDAVRLAAPPRARSTDAAGDGERARATAGRDSARARLHAAVVAVLESDAGALRTSVGEVATVVLTIVTALGTGARWSGDDDGLTAGALADLVLNGVAL
ncbi:TetR/AcrR family transcriptional regulator [Actinokineospora spheciospongiae]|nr:TetR/AcrR family transcriptional regulator [Actinokineospora spheciospongiae]